MTLGPTKTLGATPFLFLPFITAKDFLSCFDSTGTIFLSSCNSGKSDEEMEELWSKAQTTGKIIERSGTKFNSGADMELAMRDAETRLQSGGGLLGKGGLSFDGLLGGNNNKNIETMEITEIKTFINNTHVNTS